MDQHNGTDSGTDDGADSGTEARGERVVDELRALLEAVASRAQEYLQGIDAEQGAQCSAAAPCGWCPVCAAMSFARGQRPELSSRLGEQLTSLVALLRQVVEEQRTTTGADAGQQPSPQPSSGVQHIAVQRVRGSVLEESEC